MQINVDKEDIINMIKGGGTHGSYSWLNWLESNGYARYYDQYGKMDWNEENLRKLSIEELYKLYADMKTKSKCDRPVSVKKADETEGMATAALLQLLNFK